MGFPRSVRAVRKRSEAKLPPREVDVVRMLQLLGITDWRMRNGELWACCPFPDHNEHTPSWSIKEATGVHYCQGCHRGGGAVELVRRVLDLAAWSSAYEWVESKGLFQDGSLPLEVRLDITTPSLGGYKFEVPQDVRFKPLPEWVTPARRYAEERGLTEDQVERWGLGYAAGGFYAGRIILPTRNRAGEVTSIAGRAWSKDKRPKYLNPRTIVGYDPGAIFGEQFWPVIPTRCTLVLCEGELNALACERMGAAYVGALGGSQLEKEQVLKLSQFATVILAVDIDRAGTEIAEQLRATLVRWKRVQRVPFPDKRDPADLALQDPGLLKELLWGRTVPAISAG